MKSKEIQDKIDLYLLGQLDEDKKKEFEDELATNTELKEKVAIQKLIFEEVKTRADFKKAIPKPTVTKFLHVMKITLSIAAVFFGVFFINKTVVNSRMDNMFAVNFAMLEVESKRGDEMLRGNDAKLVKQFFLAIDLLQIEKIEQANEKLLQLYSLEADFEYYEDVRWYLALSQLKLHQKTEAKKYLNELKDSEQYGERVKEMLDKL